MRVVGCASGEVVCACVCVRACVRARVCARMRHRQTRACGTAGATAQLAPTNTLRRRSRCGLCQLWRWWWWQWRRRRSRQGSAERGGWVVVRCRALLVLAPHTMPAIVVPSRAMAPPAVPDCLRQLHWVEPDTGAGGCADNTGVGGGGRRRRDNGGCGGGGVCARGAGATTMVAMTAVVALSWALDPRAVCGVPQRAPHRRWWYTSRHAQGWLGRRRW